MELRGLIGQEEQRIKKVLDNKTVSGEEIEWLIATRRAIVLSNSSGPVRTAIPKIAGTATGGFDTVMKKRFYINYLTPDPLGLTENVVAKEFRVAEGPTNPIVLFDPRYPEYRFSDFAELASHIVLEITGEKYYLLDPKSVYMILRRRFHQAEIIDADEKAKEHTLIYLENVLNSNWTWDNLAFLDIFLWSCATNMELDVEKPPSLSQTGALEELVEQVQLECTTYYDAIKKRITE